MSPPYHPPQPYCMALPTPCPLPSNSPTNHEGSVRHPKWILEEDCCLVKLWINQSMNSLTEADKKKKGFRLRLPTPTTNTLLIELQRERERLSKPVGTGWIYLCPISVLEWLRHTRRTQVRRKRKPLAERLRSLCCCGGKIL